MNRIDFDAGAIVQVLRAAAIDGRGSLTFADVETLETVLRSRAELLEACEQALGILEYASPPNPKTESMLKAAIAHARGES